MTFHKVFELMVNFNCLVDMLTTNIFDVFVMNLIHVTGIESVLKGRNLDNPQRKLGVTATQKSL